MFSLRDSYSGEPKSKPGGKIRGRWGTSHLDIKLLPQLSALPWALDKNLQLLVRRPMGAIDGACSSLDTDKHAWLTITIDPVQRPSELQGLARRNHYCESAESSIRLAVHHGVASPAYLLPFSSEVQPAITRPKHLQRRIMMNRSSVPGSRVSQMSR